MMKDIKIFIILGLLSLGVTSCLDKFPDDAVEQHKAITNIDQADEAVIGIYSTFMNSALYSGYLTLLPDIQSDLVYAVNGYSNQHGAVWRWDIQPTDTEIEAVYATLYEVIGNCNFFLDNAKKLEVTLTNDDDLDYLERLCGEAYFARALAYSELIKLYCVDYKSDEEAKNELGVVITDSYYGEKNITRASLYDSYQFVIADIERAAKLLALGEDYDTAVDGELFNASQYFNEYTAYALRARIALYMRNWDDAIKYSTKIIESGYYSLASATTEYSPGVSYYQYMWEHDMAFEVIWKVGFTVTNYGGSLGRVFWNFDYSNYYPDYVPAQWVLESFDANDLRDDICFYTVATGYSHGLTWPLLYKYYGNVDLYNSAMLLHTSMPKVFRLAEQYLIRAEAYARKAVPDYNKAAKDIAALRTKRYDTSYGGGVSMNEENAMDIIEGERVKELYMEGFRLQDLKRWEKGFERKPQDQSLEHGSRLKIEADNPLFVWPIPQHEIDAPGSNIQPNKSNK